MSETQAIATAAELFGAPTKRRYKIVGPLPVLGLTVRIRSLNEAEVSAYQSAVLTTKGEYRQVRLADANRRLIALCLVDDEGNPICTATSVGQMAAWDAADTQYLYDECARHVGLNKADIEGLVKNSEPIAAAGSPTE